jgi:hypothetical protein
MLSHHPSIVKNGLVAYFDAANPKSYPAGQDPFVNNVSLMLDGESLTDKSQNAVTVTVQGAVTVDSSIKKVGNSSLKFAGAKTDYLTISNSSLFNFPGDFTIEFWTYANQFGQQSGFTTYFSNDTLDRFQLAVYPTNANIQLYLNGSLFIQGSLSASIAGRWMHIAVVRSGTTVTIYENGVSRASGTSSYSVATTLLYIGRQVARSPTDYAGNLDGYIDDLKITKGARYTANFTPPTAPLSLPGVVTDLTKNRVVGTLTNAPTYNSGNGGSIVFTRASNHYVSMGALSGSFASFSVIVWFYATDIANYENVLDCNYAYNGTTGNIGPRLEIHAAGTLEWVYSNITNNNDSYYSHPVIDSGMTANSWRCVGITYDGTGNSSITYLNGLNAGKSRVTNGSPTGFIAVMNNLRIAQGFSLASYTQRGFDGRVSMVQIYNRTLTAAEVLQNYNATKSRYGY